MSENLIYVGVDVDDQAFHFSCVDERGTVLAKGIRALCSAKKLAQRVRKVAPGGKYVFGYEAGFLGFTLARDLQAAGLDCRVIAPTSIKRCPNQRVKNDRLDSLRLALGLKGGEFVFVTVPTTEQESDRQLVRTRGFLVSQKGDLKRHILSQCRLLNLHYKVETQGKSHWTAAHRRWLDGKLSTLPSSMHIGLSCLISQLEAIERQIDTLESEIESLTCKPHYQQAVAALCCFKGIATIQAMTLATEIFDIRRFDHPKKLAAYCGLDIREYSSGGKQMQYGISKMGNKHLRTALVEACQTFASSKSPRKRRCSAPGGSTQQAKAIAERCQTRLYKKGHRLLAREKNRNKVKVACAREMIGFIWEAMRMAA